MALIFPRAAPVFGSGLYYPTDFNIDELISECTHFKQYLQIVNTDDHSILHLYNAIHETKLKTTFPNITIAFRIFLTMMVTNRTGERSFPN